MSEDNKSWFIAKCKKAKVLYDTVKMVKVIVRVVVGLLSLGGIGGGYWLMDDSIEPEVDPKAAIVKPVEELKIIHVTPEYALKNHTHEHEPGIDYAQAIKQAVKKHDPDGLGH